MKRSLGLANARQWSEGPLIDLSVGDPDILWDAVADGWWWCMAGGAEVHIKREPDLGWEVWSSEGGEPGRSNYYGTLREAALAAAGMARLRMSLAEDQRSDRREVLS